MGENNRTDNNINGSLYGDADYDAVQEPKDAGQSAVYGQQEPQPENPLQEMTPVSETENGSEQKKVAVSLEKTSREPEIPVQPEISVQPCQPNYYFNPQPGMPNQYGGQPQPGMPNQYGGQPQPGMPNQYGGQPQPGMPNQYGGQPYNYYNPPVNQGLQQAQPKKNKAGLIIGILAASVVLAAVLGVILLNTLISSPQKQLAKGFANMSKEMKAYTTSISEDIDFGALAELRKQQPVHSEIDFSITNPDPSGDFDNVSIGLDTISDTKNKQGKYDVKVGAYGMEMDAASIVADGNTLYMTSDIFFKGDVYSLDLENVGKRFNASVWADLLGTTIPEDSSYTLFGDSDTGTAGAGNAELAGILTKYSKKLSSSVKYASIKEKREFLCDGEFDEYGGVQVAIDKDAYNETAENIKNDILASNFYKEYLERYKKNYIEGYAEYKQSLDETVERLMGLEFENDIVLNFYLDKKGRIIGIDTPEDLEVSSEYDDIDFIAVDIEFAGEERTLDSIEGGIYMQSNGEILYMGISRTADVTDDAYDEDIMLCLESDAGGGELILSLSNTWTYEDMSCDMAVGMEYDANSVMLYLNGAYEDVEKGRGYTFRLGNATLNIDGEDMLIVSGVISTEPAENARIEVPGNATDLLGMSEEEIQMAVFKAYAALAAFE